MSDHIADASEMAPRRIQRSREKGWRMPPNTVYVGRGSRWGNPWRVMQTRNGEWWCEIPGPRGRRGPFGSREIATQAAVDSYRMMIEQPLSGAVQLDFAPEQIARLRGKNLACWCRLDQPCHADVLLELANAPLRCEAADE